MQQTSPNIDFIEKVPKTCPEAYLARNKGSTGALGIFLREITSLLKSLEEAYYCSFGFKTFRRACVAKIKTNEELKSI